MHTKTLVDMAFRFEYFENLVTKHHLSSAVQWEQSAKWAFMNRLNDGAVTVVSAKQTDPDTVVIVKRIDQNFGLFYRYFGAT